jgi:predicted ATPase
VRAQLGIPPSPETRALLADLRRGEPSPVSPPPSLERSHETEFVGRRAELERLRASWAVVQMHRDRRIVLVAGEPGVGKTRLAHQFGAAVLDGNATVLLGRCSEEPLSPFEPFAEALARADFAEALQPGDTVDTGARLRLFDAVDSALTDISARSPLLLMIDDLHWADHGTLLLTSFLVRSSRPGPMLVLGTYRDTEVGRRTPLTSTLAELRRSGTLDRVDLRGLTLDDVTALAVSVLGSPEIAPQGAGRVRAAGGAREHPALGRGPAVADERRRERADRRGGDPRPGAGRSRSTVHRGARIGRRGARPRRAPAGTAASTH